jgi:hypothetical protein
MVYLHHHFQQCHLHQLLLRLNRRRLQLNNYHYLDHLLRHYFLDLGYLNHQSHYLENHRHLNHHLIHFYLD